VASMGAHDTAIANLPSQEECQRQIQKLLQSTSFRNASMLQHLLQYLAAKAHVNGSEGLKEYTIGVEAFGRPQDFDPKTDTIVRVQIHRLRQKLKEYYDSDGVHDPIWIDIPKGHYIPAFECVEAADPDFGIGTAPAADATHAEGHNSDKGRLQSVPAEQRPERSLILYAMLATAITIAVFAAGLWVGSTRFRAASAGQTTASNLQLNADKSGDPVKSFWANFLGNDPTPVIAYPDEVFLLDNFNDLFRFRRGATDYRGAPVDPHLAQQFASNPALVAKAGQLYYENSYLGFGELKAVGMLSNLFGQMSLKPIIKPSRELTVDDLKQHNVIMLGSSFSNIAEAHFGAMGDFSFKNPDARLEQWRGMIINAHPRGNESAAYHTERDPSTLVLKADYSLFTIQPGIVPGRYLADLGGLDTTGSEGAVLFATSKVGIEELTRVIGGSGRPVAKNATPTFQALFKVRIERGYDVVGTSLETVHLISSTQPESGNNPSTQASVP
jgi:hypothetical protein